MKVIDMVANFRAASGALSLFMFVLNSNAWADSNPGFTASAENCPASFNVVDLGTWTIDDTGEAVFDYGGLLYRVTQNSPYGRDQVLCLEPTADEAGTQMSGGSPVPLVQHFVDVDIGARFIQRASGDYVEDVVAGHVTPFQSNELAVAAINEKILWFFKWVETAADRGDAVSSGPNYTCIFDPENPGLTGDGNYTCVASIDGLPYPETYLHCSRWGGGCFAIFQPATSIVITIQAGSLKHWEEASRIRGIPDTVSFWSDLILASSRNFKSSIVPRGRVEITEEVD